MPLKWETETHSSMEEAEEKKSREQASALLLLKQVYYHFNITFDAAAVLQKK